VKGVTYAMDIIASAYSRFDWLQLSYSRSHFNTSRYWRAHQLCDEAKPGQILISPRVLMAVEKEVAVEPVGDFALKGIRRPLTAYNVLATKAAN
jgi:hypothetical protein